MNNIHTQELDENTLLINSTDNLDYIKLLEEYDLLKLNEKKLIETNLKQEKTINNLRNMNYNSNIKNEKLNEELQNINLENKNLELDIKQMNNPDDKEVHTIKHYKDLTKFFNYYELYKAEGRNMKKWEELYNSKDSIIEMLKNNINE